MIKGKKIATLLDFNILTPWTIHNYKTIMQYERKVHQKLPRITNYIVYMYRGVLRILSNTYDGPFTKTR